MRLMTHIVAGYPNFSESEKIALTMAKNGASFIEIQFPFSDPIADGPTILKANQVALEKGSTTEKSFQLLEKLSSKTDTPLLIMTYFNVAHAYGLEDFIKRAVKAGTYGLIIPDIPVDAESYDHFFSLCKKYKVHAVQVVSPLTPPARLKKIARHASGMLYCVASYGTTGERAKLNKQIASYLATVRKHIKIPLALGFGISTPEQAHQAAKHADIVVIGSKVINVYNNSKKDKLQSVEQFIKKLF